MQTRRPPQKCNKPQMLQIDEPLTWVRSKPNCTCARASIQRVKSKTPNHRAWASTVPKPNSSTCSWSDPPHSASECRGPWSLGSTYSVMDHGKFSSSCVPSLNHNRIFNEMKQYGYTIAEANIACPNNHWIRRNKPVREEDIRTEWKLRLSERQTFKSESQS